MPSVISGDANVSATEFGFLDGVTSSLQTQIDGKFTTPGAWTSYTPTLTGFSLGAGTAAGAFTRIGRTIHFWSRFSLGSGFSTPSAGIATSLPVSASAGAQVSTLAVVTYISIGSNNWVGAIGGYSTNTLIGYVLGTSGAVALPTSTVPFTWKVGDEIRFSGTYEAAQ